MSVLEKVSARCDICWPCPRFPAHDGLALGSPSVREKPDKPCVGLSLIFYKVTVRKKRKKMVIDFR